MDSRIFNRAFYDDLPRQEGNADLSPLEFNDDPFREGDCGLRNTGGGKD